jgi:hypothetical protein
MIRRSCPDPLVNAPPVSPSQRSIEVILKGMAAFTPEDNLKRSGKVWPSGGKYMTMPGTGYRAGEPGITG